MLTLDDIQPGVALWMDPAVLARDTRITRTCSMSEFRMGPFLCVAWRPGATLWLGLTTRPHPRRFQIPSGWWLPGGPARWGARPCFINDLREPWIGRDVAFLDAARREYMGGEHARLCPHGVAVIAERMEKLTTQTA
jgi:hypothetical protein